MHLEIGMIVSHRRTVGTAATALLALVVALPALCHADPRVVHVAGEGGTTSAKIGSSIDLTIDGLDAWLAAKKASYEQLLLYLDGRPIEGIVPRRLDTASGTLLFDLSRTDQSAQAWDACAMKAWQALWTGRGFWPQFTVSVGMKGEAAIATDYIDGGGFPIVIIPRRWLVICSALVALAVLLFGWAAVSTDMLRDRGAATDSRPFSLARFQMSFWFFLVMVAFMAIWLATGNATLSSTALGLLGISAATALAAVVVDVSKGNDPAKGPAVPVISRGFLLDLLSDGGGISLHRFQMFVWTLVLGVVFVARVWDQLAMPTFDSSVLAMMGISGGTYIGFKFPEEPKKPA